MPNDPNPISFSVVTGASSGIGLELARVAARHGSDLLIAADGPDIETAAEELQSIGVAVETVTADLATPGGVDALCARIKELGRPVDALFANAGRGLGKAFLDQDFGQIERVLDTNITGTLYLLHKVVGDMRQQGWGRVLITGSIATACRWRRRRPATRTSATTRTSGRRWCSSPAEPPRHVVSMGPTADESDRPSVPILPAAARRRGISQPGDRRGHAVITPDKFNRPELV